MNNEIKLIVSEEIKKHLKLLGIDYECAKKPLYCFACEGTGRKFDLKLEYPFVNCSDCKGRGYII